MWLWDGVKNKFVGNNNPINYQLIIEEILSDKIQQGCYAWDVTLEDCEAGRMVLAFEQVDKEGMLEHCLNNTLSYSEQQKLLIDIPSLYLADIDHQRAIYVVQMHIIHYLISGRPTLTKKNLLQLLDWVNNFQHISNYPLPIPQIISVAENIIQPNEFDLNLKRKLENLKKHLTNDYQNKDIRRLKERVSVLLGEKYNLNPGDVWSDAAIDYLATLDAEQKTAWNMILDFARQSDASKPTKKWLAGIKEALSDIDQDTFFEKCREWFMLANEPRTTPAYTSWPLDLNILDDSNTDALKGLVWACALIESADNACALVKLALSCYKKIPGVGPRVVRVGNACIVALATMPGRIGLHHLSVLQVKLKYRSALQIVNRALGEAAKREGISVQELEEMGVPSYGLDQVGYGEEIIGDYTAILTVTEQKTVELTWRNAQDKIQKTIPAAIKSEFAAELKELRGSIADIKTLLSAQRDRLEKLFLQETYWQFNTWKERYLDHPIVGILTRKLIWQFYKEESDQLAIYHDGQLIDVNGIALRLDNNWQVRLWHPINSTPHVIKAWRDQIESLQIIQPFKQAHRKFIY